MGAELEEGLMNPELKHAIESGYPEAYVPDEVVAWLMGFENEIDDLSAVKLGFRFSPQAVRAMTLALANGIFTEEGYYGPPNSQFRQNVASYGYFNDFITKEDYELLAQGKGIRGNLPQEESDIWIGPKARLISNSVYATIDEVALRVDEKRKENRNTKVVLFDGKWNGVPHPGYFFLFKDTVNELMLTEKVDPEDLVFVVACASDNYIRLAGGRPFLNTLWRISLMSYLPWVDYVCASGDSDIEDIHRHWIYKTQVLWPDYISVEENHPFRERKFVQAKAAGVRVLTHRRAGMYYPIKVGSPSLERIDGPEISSGHLSEGIVGRQTEFSYSNPYAHLFTVKGIRDQLYGKRDWFASKQILLPSDQRKMQGVPEWEIEKAFF